MFAFCVALSLICIQCSNPQQQESTPATQQEPTTPPPAQPVKLTFSVFFPPTHEQAKAADAFAKEIEKATNGMVQISMFPGGSLSKPDAVYDGVVKGISDMGLSCFAYTRGKFPITAALDLPLGYPNGKIATKVANDFINNFKPEELKDVKVLYVTAHGPGLLHTKKPVKTLKDLKGMKIRATGLSAKIIEALGGIAVGMSQPETYESLQKGVVNGTIGPIEVLKGWKQAEVIKSTTDCKEIGYTTAMFVVINLTKWNSLPKETQDIIEKTSAQWTDIHGEAWDKSDAEGLEYTKEKKNGVVTLEPAESTKWKAAVQPVIDAFIKETPEGQKYVDFIKDAIVKYSK